MCSRTLTSRRAVPYSGTRLPMSLGFPQSPPAPVPAKSWCSSRFHHFSRNVCLFLKSPGAGRLGKDPHFSFAQRALRSPVEQHEPCSPRRWRQGAALRTQPKSAVPAAPAALCRPATCRRAFCRLVTCRSALCRPAASLPCCCLPLLPAGAWQAGQRCGGAMRPP